MIASPILVYKSIYTDPCNIEVLTNSVNKNDLILWLCLISEKLSSRDYVENQTPVKKVLSITGDELSQAEDLAINHIFKTQPNSEFTSIWSILNALGYVLNNHKDLTVNKRVDMSLSSFLLRFITYFNQIVYDDGYKTKIKEIKIRYPTEWQLRTMLYNPETILSINRDNPSRIFGTSIFVNSCIIQASENEQLLN